jgi:hypothetical protein
MFISGVNDTGGKLFRGANPTPLTNLSPVSTTPVINLCHGFSVIGGVVVSWAINLSLVSLTPLNNIAADKDPSFRTAASLSRCRRVSAASYQVNNDRR